MLPRPTLNELRDGGEFVRRHIGPDELELADMLAVLGFETLDALLDAVVPESIRLREPLDLPGARTEREVLTDLRALAGRNQVFTSLIGMGYHGTITPPVIERNVLENPAWYTAYTPYQPEISQGRLEALLNFQTMVADLTGMDLANASLLDEATAAAEAMAMCRRLSKSAVDVFVVHPDTPPSDASRCCGRGPSRWASSSWWATWPTWKAASERSSPTPGRPARSIPSTSSPTRCTPTEASRSWRPISWRWCCSAHPGAYGVDIAIGSAQRFGVPMGYGGPHAAFLATTRGVRPLAPGPAGRGVLGHDGRPALRLALQTREQHIRREKATSNICTAQVLLADIAGLYAVWHGPDGLARIAERVHRLTSILAAGLREGGGSSSATTWFDTLQVRVPGSAAAVLAAARDRHLNLRLVDADTVGISLDETTTTEVVEGVWAAFGLTDLRAPTSTSAPSTASRRRPGGSASCSPTPSSTATTASTSCCATYADSPTATSRSTGP